MGVEARVRALPPGLRKTLGDGRGEGPCVVAGELVAGADVGDGSEVASWVRAVVREVALCHCATRAASASDAG